MKKFQYLILFILICPFVVRAQGDWTIQRTEDVPAKLAERIPLGQSYMECVYDHTIYDPVKNRTEVEDWILEIGRDAILYRDYGVYRVDSVIEKDYPDRHILCSEYDEIARKYNSHPNYELIIDLKHNMLTYYQQVFIDNYNYEEPIPTFDWTISEEEEELCGYVCRKATTSFRGRDWTAWFAEEIPVNRGPWKFSGLPGLILKMEDSKKEHFIEAYQIRQSDRPFWRYTHSTAMKTDRLNYNKMLTDYMTNPGNFIVGQPGAPMGADGKPAIKNRRRFFNPIELE